MHGTPSTRSPSRHGVKRSPLQSLFGFTSSPMKQLLQALDSPPRSPLTMRPRSPPIIRSGYICTGDTEQCLVKVGLPEHLYDSRTLPDGPEWRAILRHHESRGTLPALGGALPAAAAIDADGSAILAANGESRVIEEPTAELSRGLSLVGQMPEGRLRARAFLRLRQASAVQTEWAVRHET